MTRYSIASFSGCSNCHAAEAEDGDFIRFEDHLAASAKVLAALQDVKTWCELNRREGSVIYERVCAALKAAGEG